MSWRVGGVHVTKLPQMSWHIPLWGMVPEATEVACNEVGPGLVGRDAAVEISIHGFLLESQGQRILVDTCAGHDDHNARILALVASVGTIEHHHHDVRSALEARGIEAGDVDVVVCTHLHADHIGGCSEGGAPVFPNARYVVAGDEWEHWSTAVSADDYESIDAQIRPLVDTGLVDLVDPDHRLTDEVQLIPTPGHTPGHVSIEIASGGRVAVITGDLVHHPIELLEPDWAMIADIDPKQVASSRRRFVERYGDGNATLFGTHFGGTSAGYLSAAERRWTDLS
jgi:glyoxylase-like metal-dependent hydrolase (beta-lactamase superfamily II)